MPLEEALSTVEPDRRRRRRLLVGLLLANLALASLLALLIQRSLDDSRQAFGHRARETAESLAAVAQVNLSSALSRIDTLMAAALTDVPALIDRPTR